MHHNDGRDIDAQVDGLDLIPKDILPDLDLPPLEPLHLIDAERE